MLPTAERMASGKIHPRDIEPVDEKVDIWALGVTFYELLTGTHAVRQHEQGTLMWGQENRHLRQKTNRLSEETLWTTTSGAFHDT